MAAAAVQVNPAEAGSKLIYPFVGAPFQTNDHVKNNGAAVVTLTADPARPIVIRQIDWSFDAAPAAGTIQVKDGSTVVWEQAYTPAAGFFSKTFDPPRCGTVGNSMTITLATGGGTVNGYLDVNAYVEK